MDYHLSFMNVCLNYHSFRALGIVGQLSALLLTPPMKNEEKLMILKLVESIFCDFVFVVSFLLFPFSTVPDI